MSSFTKLEKFADTVNMIKEFEEYEKIAKNVFKVSKNSAFKKFQKRTIHNDYSHIKLPNMKINILDGVPTIFSKYSN